jgi:uncharacterized protein (TIGR04255 family)
VRVFCKHGTSARVHVPTVRGVTVKYKNPPVVETVISVQFNPLADFGAGQLGAFWQGLGPEWPYVTDAPAVDPVFERFEPATVWEQSAFVRLSSKVDVRLQIRNKKKDRMIQVQNGRFFYNWLGTPGTEYPSYDFVRPEFDEYWDRFREFVVARTDDKVIQPNQWEILYVNHIPCGTVWNDVSDIPGALTFLQSPNITDVNVNPDALGGEWRFEIRPQKGRLYLRLAMRNKTDGNTTGLRLVMTLIARGAVGDGARSLDEGLELGHTAITTVFDRITSTRAQEFWGVQDANG